MGLLRSLFGGTAEVARTTSLYFRFKFVNVHLAKPPRPPAQHLLQGDNSTQTHLLADGSKSQNVTDAAASAETSSSNTVPHGTSPSPSAANSPSSPTSPSSKSTLPPPSALREPSQSPSERRQSDRAVIRSKGFFQTAIDTIRPSSSSGMMKNVSARPPPAVVADPSTARVTFLGHNTVLMQCGGVNLITDPLFGSHNPALMKARRIGVPGMWVTDLPQIDLVLYSHNHPLSFDARTNRTLFAQHMSVAMAGMGMGRRLARLRATATYCMQWWDTVRFDSLAITFTPAVHTSGFMGFDRDSTLWGSFLIRTPTQTIFFGGDTGYGLHFSEVFKMCREEGRRIDLALLPIGPDPYTSQPELTMSPLEACQAHKDLRARRSIAISHGTVEADLPEGHTHHSLFNAARLQHNIQAESFSFLTPGESVVMKKSHLTIDAE